MGHCIFWRPQIICFFSELYVPYFSPNLLLNGRERNYFRVLLFFGKCRLTCSSPGSVTWFGFWHCFNSKCPFNDWDLAWIARINVSNYMSPLNYFLSTGNFVNDLQLLARKTTFAFCLSIVFFVQKHTCGQISGRQLILTRNWTIYMCKKYEKNQTKFHHCFTSRLLAVGIRNNAGIRRLSKTEGLGYREISLELWMDQGNTLLKVFRNVEPKAPRYWTW